MQFFASSPALQKILYALEAQPPYLSVENMTLRPLNAFRGFKPAPGQEPEINVQLDVAGYAFAEPGQEVRAMTDLAARIRAALWWLLPLAALLVIIGWETGWGKAFDRRPAPAEPIAPKPVVASLLPEYAIAGGAAGHTEMVQRTLFNPTRRPGPGGAGGRAPAGCSAASSR